MLVASASGEHAESGTFKSASLPNGARFEPTKCWFDLTSFPYGFNNVTWASGFKARRIECGFLFTRKEQGKSFFRLPVVIVRNSLWHNSRQPVLYLAGGPGSSSWLTQKDISGFWLSYIDELAWQRDFVLFDARGTGLSQPALHCENFFEKSLDLLSKNLQPEAEAKAYYKIAHQCHQKLNKNQRDAIKQLGTQKSADDLADLAELLKIDAWHLYGTSYGTRLALEVERRHPDKVASLILDSVYPQEVDGDETLPALYLDSLEGIINACNKDAHCVKYYPHLTRELHQILQRLNKNPLVLMLNNKDKPIKFVLTPARFFSVLYDAGYSIESIVAVPNAIHSLHEGITAPIEYLAQWSVELMRDKDFSNPVFIEVECNENEVEKPRLHVANIIKKYQNYPVLKRWQLAYFKEDVCQSWGAKEVKKSFHRAVYSDKPALIFAGKFDSVTPAKWGRLLAKHLSKSQFYEFNNSAHGVLFDVDCAKQIVRQFLNPKIKAHKQCQTNKQIDWELPDKKPKPSDKSLN